MARWFLGERPGRWFWLCLPPAAAGAYLLATPDWRITSFHTIRGPETILAALGAALLWGASTVFGRYIVARVPTLVLTALRFTIALPMLALLFAVQPGQNRSMPMNIGSIALLLAMAMVPGFLALTSYYYGLRVTTASLASVGELAFPITAVAANWYVLGFRLNASQITGAVILVTAVTALTCMGSRRPAASAATPDTGTLGDRAV